MEQLQLQLAGSVTVQLPDGGGGRGCVLRVASQRGSRPASQQQQQQQLLAVCCAGSDCVQLYDGNRLQQVGSLQAGASGDAVTQCRFAPIGRELLACSADRLTLWDLRSRRAAAEFAAGTGDPLLCCDCSCDSALLCAGCERNSQLDALVVFWDRRQPAGPLGCYSECHHDSVTDVGFHGDSVNWLLSAGADGLVCVYDIGRSCEEDALQFTVNCDSCVRAVDWSQQQGHVACAVTDQEGCCCFRADTGDVVAACERLPELHCSQYIVAPLSASEASGCQLLAGDHCGQLYLVTLTPETETETEAEAEAEVETDGKTKGRSSGAAVASLALHCPSGRVAHADTVRCACCWDAGGGDCGLVTGSEDGLLCLWTPASESTAAASSSSSSAAAAASAGGGKRRPRKRRDAAKSATAARCGSRLRQMKL